MDATSPSVFLDLMQQLVDQRVAQLTDRTAYATVDPAYVSGLPRLQFDGEGVLSTKGYPYLASYTPTAGDRVEVHLHGASGTILGNVISS
jgi:hypothetical protein